MVGAILALFFVLPVAYLFPLFACWSALKRWRTNALAFGGVSVASGILVMAIGGGMLTTIEQGLALVPIGFSLLSGLAVVLGRCRDNEPEG